MISERIALFVVIYVSQKCRTVLFNFVARDSGYFDLSINCPLGASDLFAITLCTEDLVVRGI